MTRQGKNTYPIILTISLLLVAGSSTYMSVYGLMSVFMNNAIVIVCMGLGMEIGKILIVSYVYISWKNLRSLAKALYILIVSILVFLTSIEVMGFLSQSHTIATRDLRAAETEIRRLQNESAIIRKQIFTMETTLAGLPVSHVSRRINERKAHGYNKKQGRLLDIVKQQAQLEAKIVSDQGYSGPIFAAARIMKINETKAIAMFILLLVMVLEPLSIGLTVATSAAWMGRKTKPEVKSEQRTSNEELKGIQKKYTLTVDQLVKITGRKKAQTCEAWLNGTTAVPSRALRAIQAWANKQDADARRFEI